LKYSLLVLDEKYERNGIFEIHKDLSSPLIGM